MTRIKVKDEVTTWEGIADVMANSYDECDDDELIHLVADCGIDIESAGKIVSKWGKLGATHRNHYGCMITEDLISVLKGWIS